LPSPGDQRPLKGAKTQHCATQPARRRAESAGIRTAVCCTQPASAFQASEKPPGRISAYAKRTGSPLTQFSQPGPLTDWILPSLALWPRIPRTGGLPFPETVLNVNRPFSSPLLVTLPFNLQQWPDRGSIDCPNLLSPTVLTPVIASSLPQPHKRIQRLVSGILDLVFDLELVHARHLRSSAESPQYNDPVNLDVVVTLLFPFSPLPWFAMLSEVRRQSKSFRECHLHHRAIINYHSFFNLPFALPEYFERDAFV
jgi:hypothetical protein